MSENLNYLIAEGSDPLREKVGVHLQLCHDEQGGGHQPRDEEAQQRKPDSLEIPCVVLQQAREQVLTICTDICFCLGWRMNLYLSMAIIRMEKEEKKTQVAWKLPTSLQMNS